MKKISHDLRCRVAERANFSCEYCLIPESSTYIGCEIDHVISRKHGGTNDFENLAYACLYCNRYKGSDIGSILPSSSKLIRLYSPRKDLWNDHFIQNGAIIKPITDIAEVTINILKLNLHDRILEREQLIDIGLYP
jgi:hypothetical protein